MGISNKVGRPRKIKTPEELQKLSEEYFQWCIDNPLIQMDYRSAGGQIQVVNIPHPRVFQKAGLALFCGLCEWRLIEDLKKDNEMGHEFSQVITRVESVIRTQKFEYATVGMFNSNIIARDLGLIDAQRQEITTPQKLKVTLNIDEPGDNL